MENSNIIEQRFYQQFPGGIQDPTFTEMSARYNPDAIVAIFQDELSEKAIKDAIASHEFEVIVEAAHRAIKKVKVVSMFEQMAFSNFLKHKEVYSDFTKALYGFLYQFSEETFDNFVDVLRRYKSEKNANAAKWPIVSFFKAYSEPKKYIFLKPTTIKNLASVLAYDIQYSSLPNYKTYKNVVEMVTKLKEEVPMLENENMMMTQGVIYCAVDLVRVKKQ